MKLAAGVLLSTAMLLPGQQPVGFVHGTVVDPAGAVFIGMVIEVSSQEHSCKSKSNQEGKFNCQLPAGRYNVVVSDENILPYRRATVNLQPSAHVFLILRPILGGAPISIDTVFPDGDPPPVAMTFPDPKIGYEEQFISGSADVLVRYSSTTKREGQVAFRGPHLMLTMDALTIYAEELSCSNPIRTCSGKGSVIVELGQERLEGVALDIDLFTRKLVLTRDANVTRTF